MSNLNWKTLARWAGSLALAAIITSCGSMSDQGNPYAVSNAPVNSVNGNLANPGLSSSTSQGFNCPALDVNNVTPNYNYNENGTGFFQVCTSPANSSEILVKGLGSTSAGDEICVFPAQTSSANTDFQQTTWVPGSSGLPLYQCGTASLQQGTAITFPSGTQFNAAFIVDAEQANAMYECLQLNNPSFCPQQYSYGEFR